MKPISVVIITHNEEKNIERCLKSVKEIADEIVVLDSFSEDSTAEICRKYNTRFLQREWEGYSASKNFANEQASNDWILSLDADEALSEGLKTEIKKIKSADSLQFAYFNRLTNYCGNWIRHSGWYPDEKLRLFNRKLSKWQGTLHEELSVPEGVIPKHIKEDILHYSYYTLEDHLKQIEKYSDIAAKEMLDKGKRPPRYKQYLNAVAKFIGQYFAQLGFLDGAAGLRIARYSAYATYLKYSKATQLFDHAKRT